MEPAAQAVAPKKQFTLRIPADLGARLEEAYWRTRKPRTTMVIEALTAYLDGVESAPPAAPVMPEAE